MAELTRCINMPVTAQDSSKPSNFSTTIKLDGLWINFWTNGPHECTEDVVSHSHTCYEVQSALSGKYSLVTTNSKLQITAPDTVCLIPPYCPHRIRHSDPDTKLICFQFSCRKKSGQTEHSVLADTLQQLPKESVVLTGASDLCAAMRQFSQELTLPEFASEQLLNALLQQLYIQLLRCVKRQRDTHVFQTEHQPEPEIRNNRYNQIETFFQENYARPVTEMDLAKLLSVSKRQTSRILRNQYGKSFHEKLEEIRMYYAQRYLRHEQITAENVALRVGYSSASSFFVAFKKRFGMTPTEYRRTVG